MAPVADIVANIAADQVAARSAPAARTRPRLDLGFDTDRESAFRRARWHTRVVRVLRILLPVTAIAMFGSYGLFVQRSVKISKAKGSFTIDSASISTEALVAKGPNYEGFDSQGGKYVVHAATAEQDFGQKGPIRLKTIDGKLTDVNKSVTDLKARSGTLDPKTNVLELYEKIDVVSQNGMTAEMTRATVFSKEGRITSNEPVTVRMPTGVVHGNSMVIEQKKKHITFDNGVVAHLKQEPSKEKIAAQAAQAAQAAAKAVVAGKAPEGGLFAASDAPVDITSQKLFIDDLAKQAVFTGTVVAKQNDSTLETAQLEVSYEGQQTADGAPKPVATDAGSSRVKRMIARTDVVLTRGIERATGKSAEFDAATDRATLLGNVVITSGPDRQAIADRADMDNKSDTALLTGALVVVTQAKNILKGRRMFLDRKAGTMQMTAPAEGGRPKGRVEARMYQAESEAAKKKGPGGPAVASTSAWSSSTGKAEPVRPEPGKSDASKSGPGGLALKTDPSQPIDIDSDTLDVNDKVKTATFRGAVHAVQGDYTIKTEELVATYSGEAGMALGQPDAVKGDLKAKAGQPTQAGGATQLQHVKATKPVIVTTKDGRSVTGNSADFDSKANVVTLIGDVVMTQGQSISKGQRAKLDMATGLMQMEQAAVDQTVAATPGAPAGQRSRVQVLLFPKDTKGKDGKDAAKPAAASPPTAAAPASPPQQQPPQRERATGWAGDSGPFDRF